MRAWLRGGSCVAACLALAGCMRMGYHGADGAQADRPLGQDRQPEVSTDLAAAAADRDGRRLERSPGADRPAPIPGLVAAWLFDEGSGQTVTAAAGNSGFLGRSSSTDPADPMWETAKPRICSGAGLTFDGSDDVVTIPGASKPGLNRFTITFSIYATGAGGGSLSRILTKEDGAAVDLIVHFRAIDNAIAVNMFDTADTLYATFGSGVVLGQRASWALTYDDTGDRRLRVYKNGKESSYLRQDAMAGPLRTTANSWMIGNQAGSTRGFDGTIDDVRVFDRVLGGGELITLSSACSP